MIPIKEKSMEVEAIKMYLRATVMFSLAFNVMRRTAEKTVESSTNIHNNARLSDRKPIIKTSWSKNEVP